MKKERRIIGLVSQPYVLAALLIITLAIIFGTYCWGLGVHITFFRAESGLYLQYAFAPLADQWEFVRPMMLRSYNGHFTPIVFLAEFAQAKAYQTNEFLWFWRQMFVVGALGAACALYVYRLARTEMSTSWAALAGIGGCGFFLFQPFVVEMVTWPFMAFQFLVLTLMALSASMLVRYLENPRKQNFAAFILIGYATMHASGVGAAMSGAALFTGACILYAFRGTGAVAASEAKSGLVVLAIGTMLTAVHGVLMVKGAAVSVPVGEPLSLRGNAIRFFALLMDSVYAGIRAVWANGGFAWPRLDMQRVEALYGFGFFTAILIVLIALLSRYRQTQNRQYLLGFAVIGYPFFALIIYTALIVFRLRAVAPDDAVLPYLIGGRYIIFPSFFLFMMAGAIWLVLFRVLGKLSSILPIVFTLSAVAGTAAFVITEMPRIWPHTQLDHEAEWNSIVRDVKNDVAAGRPIKNRGLSKLEPDFKSDLMRARFLLERELHCNNCVKFLP